MSWSKAFLFHDVSSFVSFVRRHVNAKTEKSPYRLHRVKMAGRQQLILVGFHSPGEQAGNVVRVLIDVRSVVIHLKTEDGQVAEGGALLLETRSSHQLAQLIQLEPREEDEEGAERWVMFQLPNPDWFGTLVSQSLALGNDRIQYAKYGREDGGGSFFVRVETPSWFLLQEAFERPEVQVYQAEGDQLFFPFGYKHPFADLWVEVELADDRWLFFDREGGMLALERGTWEDVYEAISPDFRFDASGLRLQEAPRLDLRIPMRVEPRTPLAEAELWMMPVEERARLEQLMGQVDREDMKNLLFAVHEDESGKGWLFLREKKASGRLYLEFGGKAFACYKGFHNLLLPVDTELQPQLRREQYRGLFNLNPSELVLLVRSEERGGEWRCLRIADGSFVPLARYVEYRVQAHAETLKSRMEATVFDFGKYTKVPRRSDLLPRQTKGKASAAKTVSAEGLEGRDQENDAGSFTPMSADEARQQQDVTTAAEPGEPESRQGVTVDYDKREFELQSHLLEAYDDPARWMAVAALKRERHLEGDYLECLLHATWLATPKSKDETDRLREWRDVLLGVAGTRELDELIEFLSEDDISIYLPAAVLGIAGQRVKEETNQRLYEIGSALRRWESNLHPKARWLLWQLVLRLNHDEIEQARVRESIFTQLSSLGLSVDWLPVFIRNHLQVSTMMGLDSDADNEDESQLGGFAHAARNLERITSRVRNYPEPVRLVIRAMIARGWSRIGLTDRHQAAIKQVHEELAPLLKTCERQGAFDGNNSVAVTMNHSVALWVSLFIERDEHNLSSQKQAQQRVTKWLSELPERLAKPFADVRESLAAREEMETLAELLSSENVRVYFPTNAKDEDENVTQLAEQYDNGELTEAAFANGVFERMDAWEGDMRAMAQRLRQVQRVAFSKLQWGTQRAVVVNRFAKFVERFETRKNLKSFYGCLALHALAHSLVLLERGGKAVELLSRSLNVKLTAIDEMDVRSDALRVIECLPLSQRRALLGKAVGDWIKEPGYSSDGPTYLTPQLRVIDQAVEAATSKERLMLTQFRQLLDQEEFILRRRLLSEDFNHTPLS